MTPTLGIIFDLDGVITETADLHEAAWFRLAEAEGFTPSVHPDTTRGLSRRASLLQLLGDDHAYDEPTIARMLTVKNDWYVTSLDDLTADAALPGAVELVDACIAGGHRVAIGSSSRNARTVLRALGLEDRFAAISDGHSVTNSKPAPDIFVHAAGQLGLPTSRCVVFEDAASGVDAALAAGMVAVGIGPAERVGHATVRFDDVASVDLEAVLAPFASTP